MHSECDYLSIKVVFPSFVALFVSLQLLLGNRPNLSSCPVIGGWFFDGGSDFTEAVSSSLGWQLAHNSPPPKSSSPPAPQSMYREAPSSLFWALTS